MSKIKIAVLEIESCGDCLHYNWKDYYNKPIPVCCYFNKDGDNLPKDESFPDWCPWEDKE